MFKKIQVATIGVLALHVFVPSTSWARDSACTTPIVFFDFGETIIRGEYVKAFDVFVNDRYTPGAYNYLSQLKSQGYQLAMLVNYPESYGGGLPTVEARDQRKIDSIKHETTEPLSEQVASNPGFIKYCQEKFGADAGKACQTWTDPDHQMEWSMFDLPEFADLPGIEAGGILVPDLDTQRKPSPYLFDRAMQISRRLQASDERPCPIVFMGENAGEIRAANQAGMIGIQVGEGSWPVGSGEFSFFYPEALLRDLVVGGGVVAPTGPKL